MQKSVRLERVRKQIRVQYKGNAPEVFAKYAVHDPPHGLKAGKPPLAQVVEYAIYRGVQSNVRGLLSRTLSIRYRGPRLDLQLS